jgi:hypothetical protein
LVYYREWCVRLIHAPNHANSDSGFGCEAQPKQPLVSEDIVRGSCGIAMHNKLAANETLGELERQSANQIEDRSESGLETG